jgi:hypothetical protein
MQANELEGSRNRSRNQHDVRQRLWNGGLDNEMRGMAQRAVRLNRLAGGVGMPYLYDPAERDERAAEQTEPHPQPMADWYITALPWHRASIDPV